MRLGIVGAGKLGTTLTRAAIAAGYDVAISGSDDELAAAPSGTSTVVQRHFPSARVVKSLNQLGYHELDEYPRPRGAGDRVAIGAAGDDPAAVRTVMRLIDRLGFDPVDAGPLDNGRALEPDGSPFAVTYSAEQLAPVVSADLAAPPLVS